LLPITTACPWRSRTAALFLAARESGTEFPKADYRTAHRQLRIVCLGRCTMRRPGASRISPVQWAQPRKRPGREIDPVRLGRCRFESKKKPCRGTGLGVIELRNLSENAVPNAPCGTDQLSHLPPNEQARLRSIRMRCNRLKVLGLWSKGSPSGSSGGVRSDSAEQAAAGLSRSVRHKSERQ
jgi:hypothetical protein